MTFTKRAVELQQCKEQTLVSDMFAAQIESLTDPVHLRTAQSLAFQDTVTSNRILLDREQREELR